MHVDPWLPAEVFTLFEPLMLQELLVADKQGEFSSSPAQLQAPEHMSEAEH